MTRVPEAMRGRAMAGFTGLWDIASLVAAPAVGKGIDVYGDSLAFWAMGAVALFGVSGWARLSTFRCVRLGDVTLRVSADRESLYLRPIEVRKRGHRRVSYRTLVCPFQARGARPRVHRLRVRR